jgi:hypothetical protein
MGPHFANLVDDPLHFSHAPGTGIDVGGSQPSTQQLVTTENVQRQIAVVVVVTMEEARFLLPMQGVSVASRFRTMDLGALR